jgi:hypothetical protein
MPTKAKPSGQMRRVGKTSGPPLNRYLGATVRTADRIDYWIRRRVIESPLGLVARVANQPLSAEAQMSAPAAAPARASAHRAIPAPRAKLPSKFMLACDRRAWLSALGRSLKAEYDALAAPLPPRLAALVRQLEAQD